MKAVVLFISEDGTLEFIHDDEVAEALRGNGRPRICRASHVEPTDDGWWSVDVAPIVGALSPMIIGAWPTRAAALAAELEWVLDHLARAP